MRHHLIRNSPQGGGKTWVIVPVLLSKSGIQHRLGGWAEGLASHG
jgi:hypothetical protein